VAPERYALQVTIGQRTHDKLRHAQALLGHSVPSGEVAEVFDRALDALIVRLEFDHVEPVARGGRATVAGIRLRCRAHNQYAAECAFGAGFMSRKREAARRAAEEMRAHATAGADEARARAATEAEEARARAAAVEEVVPWLHAPGLRMDEARRAAARCETAPDAPLEERVRHALRCSGRPSRRCATHTPQPAP
jgi:hypothetical protein